ncbi:Abscisic acid 8'-hydroxylase 3 [Acorus calamus]|uniref:Abscisic acid 8'-hydroxylase 3 n=1 Tax=Acorus calamus TaxID=4465 RepID=A0AAV9DCM0_ACOCL|nr:Abscisic acid 8'-hydroxylase 3 [Acorus calamus]
MKGESPCEAPLTDDAKIQDNILFPPYYISFLSLKRESQITTASAITWMVKYLDENQEIQERVRIVKETLRMASIVSWFPRVALRDCYIEGLVHSLELHL